MIILKFTPYRLKLESKKYRMEHGPEIIREINRSGTT